MAMVAIAGPRADVGEAVMKHQFDATQIVVDLGTIALVALMLTAVLSVAAGVIDIVRHFWP